MTDDRLNSLLNNNRKVNSNSFTPPPSHNFFHPIPPQQNININVDRGSCKDIVDYNQTNAIKDLEYAISSNTNNDLIRENITNEISSKVYNLTDEIESSIISSVNESIGGLNIEEGATIGDTITNVISSSISNSNQKLKNEIEENYKPLLDRISAELLNF